MLIKVSSSEVYVPRLHGDSEAGIRLISVDGFERRITINEARGGLISEPNGTLLCRLSDGLAIVDPDKNFATTELSKFDGDLSEVAWTSYVAGYLVDSQHLRYSKFELEKGALAVDDPGFSMPSGYALISGTLDILVTLNRDRALRLVNVSTNKVRKIELPGSGSSNPTVDGEDIVFSNYDTLCRLGSNTHTVKTATRLQPSVLFSNHGLQGRAFIGVPHKSRNLGGWLVPRPYSSDILFVEPEFFTPTGVIRCGGKPFSLVEFEDGSLFVIDHPFDSFQRTNISELSPI